MVDETQDENIETEVEAFDPPEIDSKYRMIILAAQRSKQLHLAGNNRLCTQSLYFLLHVSGCPVQGKAYD